jgi:hypothetical protein
MATTNSRDNLDSYRHVCNLTIELLRHPTYYLNSDDLASNGIEVAAMDIKTGTPADSGPQFCDLYPSREFDAMFKMVDKWPEPKGPGAGHLAVLQMRRLIEKSLLDGGLASQSKYVWRR